MEHITVVVSLFITLAENLSHANKGHSMEDFCAIQAFYISATPFPQKS